MLDEFARVPGPWTHRTVAANGARFHVAELGEGPLVLLVHGFPEFWWAWRHQLPPLAEAGFRVAAMDLRGFGGSDKTPRGYDPFSVAGDLAGVVRALGYRNAAIVGHGWGAFFGWVTAVLRPEQVNSLAVLSMAHPRQMRAATRDLGQIRAAKHLLGYQLPLVPERRLVKDAGAEVERVLRAWSAPGSSFPDAEAATRYRDALSVWPAPHCALEYHRWVLRSLVRSDGRRFAQAMAEPVRVPVLQVHGGYDPTVLERTARGSGAYVDAPYRWALLPESGHFPHEEVPDQLTALVSDWLTEYTPRSGPA